MFAMIFFLYFLYCYLYRFCFLPNYCSFPLFLVFSLAEKLYHRTYILAIAFFFCPSVITQNASISYTPHSDKLFLKNTHRVHCREWLFMSNEYCTLLVIKKKREGLLPCGKYPSLYRFFVLEDCLIIIQFCLGCCIFLG